MKLLQLALIVVCIAKAADSNNIYQYGFKGPIVPSWNKTLTDITLKNNMYLEFDIMITKDTFNKPGQMDNIFCVGSNCHPAVFINIADKSMIFKFVAGSKYMEKRYPNLEINKLYHVNIDRTKSNIQIMVNNTNVYRVSTSRNVLSQNVNKSLYVSDILHNSANVILLNFSIITSDSLLTKFQIKNVKKYHSDIKDIDIKYWLRESQISEDGIKYFVDEEEMDGEVLALLVYNEPQIKQEYIKHLNEQKMISLKDRLRFEIGLNKLIGSKNETKPEETIKKHVNNVDKHNKYNKCKKYREAYDNDVYQYGFLGPFSPSYNTTLTNVTIKDNIYIEFDLIVSEGEFNKQSQIDNIFHIGSNSENQHYSVTANIDTQRRQIIFMMKGDYDFDNMEASYQNVEFNKLYHIIIRRRESDLVITANSARVYYKKRNNNNNNNDDDEFDDDDNDNKCIQKINNSVNVNQTLYFSNMWNGAADVVVSDFTMISSNNLITNSDILNAKHYSKYPKNALSLIDDTESCGFKKSFYPIQNSIVDYLNIKSNIYLKFNIVFNKQYEEDYEADFDISEYNDFSEDSEEPDEGSNIFNILHIGDSAIHSFPSIYFNDKNEIMIFRFGTDGRKHNKNMIEPYYKVETEKKYRVEIYKQSHRFQIAINKYSIYDNTFNYNSNYDHDINNQPIYISNPWQNPANAKMSQFSVVTSNKNISKADNLQKYPYEYCLLLNGQNGQLDGIWKPNGTYNGHHLFIKDDLPAINYPFIYLFYYSKSWRIYTKPYDISKPLNAPKYFLKCDIDTYNVLSCNKKFNFNHNNFKDVTLISGDCDVIGKHTPEELVNHEEWMYNEIQFEFEFPTPEPTAKPTHPPIYTRKSSQVVLDFITKYSKYWQIVLVAGSVIIWCCVCVSWRKRRKSKQEEAGKAQYIPFSQQKEYQTDMF